MYSCRYTVLVHDVIPDVISSVMLVGMQRGQVKHVTSIPQLAPLIFTNIQYYFSIDILIDTRTWFSLPSSTMIPS
jgi:hypothetical protein